MKKSIILCALVALLCGCNKNEPQANHQVTFQVAGMVAENQPLKVAPLTDDDGIQMTDLYMFDGSDIIAHQQNTDDDFGTITVLLTAGTHHLHFIATRSTGLSYADGVLNCTNLRPTFGKHYDINVTGGSEQNLSLDRLTGQVIITIEDEIPSGANQLRIQFGDYYKGINPTTFAATRIGEFDQPIDISGKVGSSDNSWTLNVLVPVYGEEHETTFTLTATNAGGDVIGVATGTMMCNSNTKTLLHGELFKGTNSILTLTTSWKADEDVTF